MYDIFKWIILIFGTKNGSEIVNEGFFKLRISWNPFANASLNIRGEKQIALTIIGIFFLTVCD